MKYADLNSSLEAHIATLRVVISVLTLINFSLWYGWNQSKNDIRIHIPPDIRSGAVLKADEVTPANVYAFASYIFQQLNHWERNGEKDYGLQIFMMSAYLTPDFTEFLTNDLDIRGRGGELNPETNPWGLALDGYGKQGPTKLSEVDLSLSKGNSVQTNKPTTAEKKDE